MTIRRLLFDRSTRFIAFFAVAAASMLVSPPAQAQATHDTWTTDGTVYAMAPVGNVLYVGGSFTRIGPATGGALLYDASSAQPLLPTPAVAGGVNAVAPDGAGGWYIGGSFTTVQRQPRNNLAHLDASGNVTPWNPNANGPVNALVRVGTTIYVGGSFTQVAGLARATLAAVDTAGIVGAWNPGTVGGVVNALAARTTPTFEIYAGGTFVVAGGVSRIRVAAFDGTGAVLPWNPNADGVVYALAANGGTVYLGGTFSNVNGTTGRHALAEVDAATGVATTWNPGANSVVYAVAIGGGSVYVGGGFTTAGGQPRTSIAAIDPATGLATTWDAAPSPSGYVRSLAIDGTTVYAGGRFTQIGGQARLNLAALDATTALATTWAPLPNGDVDALGIGPTVFAGGLFTSSGGVARSNLAAIDLTTGHATSWNPGPDNVVQSLLPSGGRIFIAGDFLHIGGQPRNYIAAIDRVSGTATAWNATVIGGDVLTMAQSGSTLYMGGGFTFVGGQQRTRLAAVDTSTAAPTGWHPATNGQVATMTLGGGVLYVGGGFGSIGPGPLAAQPGDSVRSSAAAVDAATGAILAWNPYPTSNLGGSVAGLVVSGGNVYVGGSYATIGGQSRRNLSAVDAVTGLATAWNPNPHGLVRAMALDGGLLYVGGTFDSIGTDAAVRNRIAALDPTTGATTSWDANAGGTVNTLVTGGGLLFAGGQFATMSNRPIAHLAVLTATTTGVAPALGPLAAQMEIAPNPSRGTVRLRFRMPAAGEGEVALYDLRGRRVRVLARGRFPAGDQSLAWDGRDTSGRRVAPGIYFGRVRAGGLDLVGRVLRLE